ncbi:unnamed protein product [Dibothriocephalus latus]|uniref:Uncharacterized protein n=1 Tax=Dibothriocephalus latus TaxID=60516 RepID=A0A3P7KYI4_DIBLA|nr:unnamed protein product [Dibothriocephalus latus]
MRPKAELDKYGVHFSLDKRARWEHREMLRLWHGLSTELGATLSPTAPIRTCLLSDFARLPAVEASAWLPPDEVIHMEATADDIFVPENDNQPIINPFTRLCLVGSSSLASFSGALPRLGLLLTLTEAQRQLDEKWEPSNRFFTSLCDGAG